MKILSTRLPAVALLWAASVLPLTVAHAETFYVDYVAGDDARAGTSAQQSWKHFPGAKSAGALAKARLLAPGDSVIFKGGIEYPGEIDLSASGTENNPIVLDGNSAGTFGTGQAIFSGEQTLTGWKACASSAEAGGAPNWRDCFGLDLPKKVDPFALNLFYDDGPQQKRGIVARNPNIRDPFWWQDLEGFAPVPDGALQPTSLQLPATLVAPATQSWQGAFIGLWNKVNLIELRPILATSTEGDTLSFAKAAPRKTGNRIALFNHPRLLDQRGEYAITGDGKRLIFHNGAAKTTPQVRIAARSYGINLNGQSHIMMRGFRLRNYAGALGDRRAGAGIISWPDGQSAPRDITIENCTIVDNQSLGRVAALQLIGINGLRVTGCIIEGNQGSPGALFNSCQNVTFARNTLTRNGGTGIRVFDSSNVVIEGNIIREHLGMHANGISIYLDSRDVKVTRNVVESGRIAFTLQSSRDVEADYNIFATNSEDNPAVAIWPPLRKLSSLQNLTLRNNVIVNADNKGLTSSDKTATGVRLFNNIISGSTFSPANAEAISNNLYTSLSWQQNKPDWKWETGAIKSGNTAVFVDAATGDFRLTDDSPARDAGMNWGQKTDLLGATMQGAPDIGAYEKP